MKPSTLESFCRRPPTEAGSPSAERSEDVIQNDDTTITLNAPNIIELSDGGADFYFDVSLAKPVPYDFAVTAQISPSDWEGDVSL